CSYTYIYEHKANHTIERDNTHIVPKRVPSAAAIITSLSSFFSLLPSFSADTFRLPLTGFSPVFYFPPSSPHHLTPYT
ncbi:hypothetical protein, partial [Serratia marcescens]|uniref:hypothetical protein n=1 Tax=Serratia marcescens TaxID=615 RepID=UPI001C377BF5